MLHDYDFEEQAPHYAREDDRYSCCLNAEEAKIQRLVLTYVDYVEQRYGTVNIGPTTFKPDKKGKSLRTMCRKTAILEKIVEQLQDRDPAHFISYVFETWKGRGYYATYAKRGLDGRSGVAYPSWQFILFNWQDLVQEFMLIQDYKPTGFVPAEDIDQRWKKAIEGRVARWCDLYQTTPKQYWTRLMHLFPPHLTYQEMEFATSLWENRADVERKLGFTLEELQRFLFELSEEIPQLDITRLERV